MTHKIGGHQRTEKNYTFPDGTDAGNIKTIVPSGSCGIRSSINRVIIQHLSNTCSFNII